MHAPAAARRKPAPTWGNAAGPGLHNVYYRTSLPLTSGPRRLSASAEGNDYDSETGEPLHDRQQRGSDLNEPLLATSYGREFPFVGLSVSFCTAVAMSSRGVAASLLSIQVHADPVMLRVDL